MKKIITCLLTLLISSFVFSQNKTIDTNITEINVIKDDRIDEVKQSYHSTFKLKGYRIQIFSGNIKKEANKIRLKFTQLFDETETYSVYEQPYFKVRVGNFKTKIEALEFKIELTEEFPNCFIVKDNIEFIK